MSDSEMNEIPYPPRVRSDYGKRQNKRPAPYGRPQGSQRRPPPRKQFPKQRAATPQTKTNSYSNFTMGEKAKPPVIQPIAPAASMFPVPVTNQGINQLCTTVFATLQSVDRRLAVTLPQFKYVTCLAYWNRLSQLGLTLGYAYAQDRHELEDRSKGIKLPMTILSYIQAIGEYKSPMGTVVPYFPEPNEDGIFYTRPLEYWLEGHPGLIPPEGPWTLDSDWITHWNNNILRCNQKHVHFDLVDNTNTEGKVEMMVSLLPPEEHPDQLSYLNINVRAVCHFQTSTQEAQVGGCYFYRNYRQYNEFPGENSELLFMTHASAEFDPQVKITSLVLSQQPLSIPRI